MITINGVSILSLPPVHLRVPEVKSTWLKKQLVCARLRQPDKVFTIPALSINTITRIGRIMKVIDIPEGYLADGSQLLDKVQGIVKKHKRAIAKIITIAIENRHKKASRHTMSYLLANMSPADLQQALGVVIHQMDMASFLKGLSALKGLQIFRNPENQNPDSTNPPEDK